MKLVKSAGAGAALAACAALFISGCGRSSGASLSLDKELARQSLVAFLDAWKAEQTPADLQNHSPPIIAGEHEWAAGTKLLAYDLVGDEFDDGANLHTSADLTLKDARGAESRERVQYIIGTQPKITVFRAE